MGTGIKRMQNLMKEAELNPIKFEFTSFVTAVFGRISLFKTDEKIFRETTQEKILQLIIERPEIIRNEISKEIGISANGIKYHLDKLRKEKIIRHVGPTKKGHWEIVKK